MFQDKQAKNHFYLLLALWFLVNLVQAIFTEINPDEAYYALYGQHLAWGYFDHPPLVALIPFIGSMIFKGNLAVRFITVILQIPTLFLIWKQLDVSQNASKKQVTTFFIVAASMVMFTVYGFTTTPDVWLIFFTAAFLFVYKQFLKTNSWLHTLLLAITMAGLVYSKYQGVILIGLVVLSNIKIVSNGKFWIAGIIGIALCAPHFYWQFANDFPSFTYHLVGRSKPFKWSYFFEYLPNQLVTFNPFTLGAVVYIFIKFRPKDLFEKALYFIIPGFILIFWALTYKGHAEPQWTVAASIPMMILICNRAASIPALQRYIFRWIFGSIGLLLVARILLIGGLMPEKTQLSGKEKKFKAIETIAGNNPVVFTGSYQNPSLYTFFTGKPATVKSSLTSRNTQFDLWKFDKEWAGKPVYISASMDSISTKNDVNGIIVDGADVSAYQYESAINFSFDTILTTAKNGTELELNTIITNTSNLPISLFEKQQPLHIVAIFVNKKDLYTIHTEANLDINNFAANSKQKHRLRFILKDILPAKYKFALGLMSFAGPKPSSEFYPFTIQ